MTSLGGAVARQVRSSTLPGDRGYRRGENLHNWALEVYFGLNGKKIPGGVTLRHEDEC